MSRYIDAEKIELKFPDGYDNDGLLYVPFRSIQKCIDNTPTADVEPVVRCAECKFFNREDATTNGMCRCDVNKLWQPAHFRPYKRFGDFCSYGER